MKWRKRQKKSRKFYSQVLPEQQKEQIRTEIILTGSGAKAILAVMAKTNLNSGNLQTTGYSRVCEKTEKIKTSKNIAVTK